MLAITDYQSQNIHALHLYENKTNNQTCVMLVQIITLSAKLCLTIFGWLIKDHLSFSCYRCNSNDLDCNFNLIWSKSITCDRFMFWTFPTHHHQFQIQTTEAKGGPVVCSTRSIPWLPFRHQTNLSLTCG